MIRRTINIFVLSLFIWGVSYPGYSYSARHHLINAGKNVGDVIVRPLHGIFVKGPKNIKDAYEYEVWGREEEQKRGLLRYRLFALWRAPGEEVKGIIDGLTGSVKALGNSCKEIISIFFSD